MDMNYGGENAGGLGGSGWRDDRGEIGETIIA